MKKEEAYVLVEAIIKEAKSCPFCGTTPEFGFECLEDFNGYTKHYAHRKPCCRATSLGQTELFFTAPTKGPDYELWITTVKRLIENWNRRV